MLTEKDLLQYHQGINEQVFDGLLPTPTIQLGPSRFGDKNYNILGEYWQNGWGKGMILIDPELNPTNKAKLCVLAHEMIHQWQDLNGFRLDHNKIFRAWCVHINRITGLEP